MTYWKEFQVSNLFYYVGIFIYNSILIEQAYCIERGSRQLSDIIAEDGVVPLTRFFLDAPNIIAYFTLKDKSGIISFSFYSLSFSLLHSYYQHRVLAMIPLYLMRSHTTLATRTFPPFLLFSSVTH